MRSCACPRPRRSSRDHFPRRPVFPGTLLLDTQIGLAVQLAGEAAPLRHAGSLAPVRVSDVKMRAFIPPGQVLELRLELQSATPEGATIGHRGARERQAGLDRARRHRAAEAVVTQSRRRVAITGLGLVTPAGNDVATTWSALLAARSAVAPIRTFDASGFPVRIAAEVKGFEPERVIDDRKLLKSANRSHRFALAAAEQAIRDAGIAPTPETGTRWGCVVGTGMMGVPFEDLADVHRRAAPERRARYRSAPGAADGSAADPMVFCRSQSTAGVALLMRRFGIRGYASSVHTACASGGQAIGTALKVIRRGIADRVARRRLRLDDQPGRARRVLPAERGLAGQRHAGAREPPVRRDAQRLRPRRGRRLPRARGVGVRPQARRADLRGAGGRRELAVELPHHRFAPVGRRSHPGDAPGAARRRARRSPTWTT